MVPRPEDREPRNGTGAPCHRWRRLLGFAVTVLWMIGGCATPPGAGPGTPRTLAIWNVEEVHISAGSHAEMADLLTARIVETAGTMETYDLVEREQLLAILEELNLGSSQVADEATGLRIGRLAGARLMLFGSFQVVATQMRIDLRLVEVETGRIMKTAERVVAAGDMTAWLQGAEAATRELLTQ